jgi:hypothetical protein
VGKPPPLDRLLYEVGNPAPPKPSPKPLTWAPETRAQRKRRQERLHQLDRLLYELEQHNGTFGGTAVAPVAIQEVCWWLGLPRYYTTGAELHTGVLALQSVFTHMPREESPAEREPVAITVRYLKRHLERADLDRLVSRALGGGARNSPDG